MKYFLTAWLRQEDDERSASNYREAMEEIVKKYGSIAEAVREAKSGRRLTVTGLCEIPKGERAKNMVDRIAMEISKKIDRVVKGKPLKD